MKTCSHVGIEKKEKIVVRWWCTTNWKLFTFKGKHAFLSVILYASNPLFHLCSSAKSTKIDNRCAWVLLTLLGHCFISFIQLLHNTLALLTQLVLTVLYPPTSTSTLVIGGAGSLMLDLYGWESVFYVSGVLSVLWAYCMWKYLLKGEGKFSDLFKSDEWQEEMLVNQSWSLKVVTSAAARSSVRLFSVIL